MTNNPIFLLLLLLFHIYSSLAFFETGYQIRELETNDACTFNRDLQNWGVSKLVSTSVQTVCNGIRILGGSSIMGTNNGVSQWNEFFYRNFNNLPPHTMAYFTLSLWGYGSWNGATTVDYFLVQFDQTTLTGWNYNYPNFPSPCGLAVENVRVFGTAVHNYNQVSFRVVSRFDQLSSNEAIGIRNINILFVSNPTTTANTICGVSTVPINYPVTKTCPCIEGEYDDGTNCVPCHFSCSSCFGYGSNYCYQCATGYSFDGTNCIQCHSTCQYCFGPGQHQCITCQSGLLLFYNNTCIPATDCVSSPFVVTSCSTYCQYPCDKNSYYYWNNTCLDYCEPPLTISYAVPFQTLAKKCDSPCTGLNYLYWEGTCGPCVAPLSPVIETTKRYCRFPCQFTTDFLYQNGTCSSECAYPLIQRVDKLRNFCDYPCTLLTQFLYWEGTCAACPFPLVSRTENDKRWCDYPCFSDQYLYWNGTCSFECAPPLTVRVDKGKNYCDNLCGTSSYFYPDGSCQSDCKMPFVPRIEPGVNFCDQYCPLVTQIVWWNGTCLDACDSPLRIITNSTGTFCYPPCDDYSDYWHEATEQCLDECNTVPIPKAEGLYEVCIPYVPPEEHISFLRMLNHVPFINITLPSKLKNLKVGRGNNVLSIRVSSKMLASAQNYFTRTPIPEVYQRQGLHSSFVANFADDLMLLAIILGAALIFTLLEWFCICMNWSTPQVIFERLRVLTRWNIPLLILATNMGDIIFFSSLDFRSFNSENTGASLSLIVATTILITVAILIISNILLIIGAQDTKAAHSVSENANYLTRWQGLQVLFRGFRDNHWLHQSFFLIYCTRTTLPMLVTATLYNHPMVQATFYLIFSIAILIYIIYCQPIKKRTDLINLIILELLLFFVNLSLFILTVLDVTGKSNEKVKEFFGDVIIACNFGVSILAVVALIGKIAFGVQAALNYQQSKSIQARTSWLQLLWIPIQQGFFGFEQVQIGQFKYSKFKGKRIVPEDSAVLAPKRNIFSASMYNQQDGFEIDTITDFGNRTNDAFPIQRIARKGREDLNISSIANFTDSFPIEKIAHRSKRISNWMGNELSLNRTESSQWRQTQQRNIDLDNLSYNQRNRLYYLDKEQREAPFVLESERVNIID